MRWWDFAGERRRYRYNLYGDLAEEDVEQSNLLGDDDTPCRWTQRFRYCYDERNNWTERVTEQVALDAEATISMIERREISYYGDVSV